jgi:replicative DNA helicase
VDLLATASNKKQKLIIQDLLTSPEIYTRVAGILKAEYFDVEYARVVKFVHEYYDKYSAVPAFDLVNAEFEVDLEPTEKITKDRMSSTCDAVERFCRESAAKDAVYKGLELIDKDDMGKLLDLVQKAAEVSLQKDLGIDIYENPEERLKSLVETFTPIPTLIEGIDGPLDGGLIRKQFTLFSANSGGGKSLMLQNLGNNYSIQGLHVLNLTLELAEELVFLRLGAILSGVDASAWKSNIPEISAGILNVQAHAHGGSYIVKKLPVSSTALDIRSYLKFYEIEYGRVPDVILIDYLDLMHPNGGINGIGVFDQDKQKSEEVTQIIQEYDMIGVSASQQNREAINVDTPTQAGIAGGLSKVNTVDNYISLYMDDTMSLDGVMNAYFLKCRSSRGKGRTTVLGYNPLNLRIGNHKDGSQVSVMPTRRNKKILKEEKEKNKPKVGEVTVAVAGMPGVDDIIKDTVQPPENLFEVEEETATDVVQPATDVAQEATIVAKKATPEDDTVVPIRHTPISQEDADGLIGLMENLGT